ncbi:eukaryotic translation initiation factor 3, subunit 3 gamma, isoform CRA_g [Rattus norvegicus]|uniref:Eukaryotic translation initiation factor 3, subunit 3 gamma, isoform CRA_g n=1 Tax=Rattus norvegicus TaxID=10116 RepID=A6HRD4_RAT|nr:eukaryotic translation initiation factor 3, subunit 3 gamma, isoform CRA_g [Rattus norvegicus]
MASRKEGTGSTATSSSSTGGAVGKGKGKGGSGDSAVKQVQIDGLYQQRRQQENMQRQSRGEPPLPEEDLSKLFKPHQAPARMDSLLIAGQINTYCQNIKEFTAQNLGKLFMAQALQEYSN